MSILAIPSLRIPSQFRNFEVLTFIAVGLSGEVYKARYLVDNSIVALKIFNMKHKQTVLGYCVNEQMLLREVTQDRQHPYIVEYVTSDTTHLPYCLATRYIEGAQSLETILKRPLPLGFVLLKRPLPPGFVLKVVEQIGGALDYLHYGHPKLSPIIHRDIKPHNIMIDAADNAMLIDLSIARHRFYAFEEEQGLGTPQYMAPEQYKGAEVPETDQFALACIALQMLVGRALLPRTADRAFKQLERLRDTQYAEVLQQLDGRLQTAKAIIGALQFDPTQRYTSCTEFAYRLRQSLIADGQPVDGGVPPKSVSSDSLGYIVIGIIIILAIVTLLLALRA